MLVILFPSLFFMANASPIGMIKDGSYTIEYYQMIGYRGNSVFDNRDNAILWPGNVVAVIKFSELPDHFLVKIGHPRYARENAALFVDLVIPGKTVQIAGAPSIVGPTGSIYEMEYVITEHSFTLEEPFYADVARNSVSSGRSVALFILPDILEWHPWRTAPQLKE